MSNKAYSDESIVRCPACGSEVWIHEVEFTDGDIWFTPRCSECNVAWAENYPTYEDAVAAWNETWDKNNNMEPQKDSDEVVRALKGLLPEKVDYAELVGSPVPSSYGVCYVWDDPEPYIIQNGIDLITRQQDDVLRLSALNKEVMELLAAAAANIPHICETCSVEKRVDKDCYCNKDLKSFVFDSWSWQYADRYEALKERISETT